MSQNYYQQNLNVLKDFHPSIAQIIDATKDLPALSLVKSQGGTSDIQLNFGDGSSQSFYKTDPQVYSKDLIARLNLKNPRILFFLGLGLGYHLSQYIQNPHFLNQVIVIIEPYPQIFKMAMQTVDLAPVFKNKKVFIFTGKGIDELKKFLSDFFNQTQWLKFANAIEYLPLPVALEMNPGYFKDVERFVQQAIGHNFNLFFSDPYDAYRGVINILENLPAMLAMPGLDQAKGVFAKSPGMVIASGPSLTLSLPFIKGLQDKVVMAACPSALAVLYAHSIHPHLWVHTERVKEQSEIFSLTTSNHDYFFLGTPLVHPKCFSAHHGKNIYMLSTVQSKWLPFTDEPLSFGHSSAHAAFAALARIGCDPIYLVGQDLSYEGDLSHAKGISAEASQQMIEMKKADKKIFEVEGNSGEPVKLNMFWHTYLKSFTDSLIPKYQGKVFNVMPQNCGAKILGTERINPDELVKNRVNPDLNVFTNLSEVLNQPGSNDVELRKKLAATRIEAAKLAFKRVTQDCEKYALAVKKLQFSPEVAGKDWHKAKGPYQEFMKYTENFLGRHFNNKDYEQDRFHYEQLFFAVIQGMTLRYFIDYYTSGSDQSGDFNEINRKLEILFHMAKDQAFWAGALVSLLEKR